MGKIAVTGGAGFVGSNLVRTLLRENYEVLILDDFSTGLKSNLKGLDCEIKNVCLTDYRKVYKALRTSDYIFHLGARGSVPRSLINPRATINVNVIGTINVLECARRIGANVAFASSSSVYGSNLELPKNEGMWTAPITPYAASKLSGEMLFLTYAKSFGISATTYRFFNIFGPWQRPDHDYAAVIPKWIWKLIQKQKIEIYGDGYQSRDFTYINDVSEILVQGMKKDINHPGPINLAFGSRITLNELIELLRFRFPRLEVNFLHERSGDVKHSQNDPALLQSIFPNVKPKNFSDALDSTYQWFLEHGSEIANGPKITD